MSKRERNVVDINTHRIIHEPGGWLQEERVTTRREQIHYTDFLSSISEKRLPGALGEAKKLYHGLAITPTVDELGNTTSRVIVKGDGRVKGHALVYKVYSLDGENFRAEYTRRFSNAPVYADAGDRLVSFTSVDHSLDDDEPTHDRQVAIAAMRAYGWDRHIGQQVVRMLTRAVRL